MSVESDSRRRFRRGARFEWTGDELTLVGTERAEDLSRTPSVVVIYTLRGVTEESDELVDGT